jgi:hypothetical protein
MYKDELNLTCGALVLNVTKGERHMQNLIDLTVRHSNEGKNTVHLYQMVTGFGTVFKPPEVFTHLLAGEWSRAGVPSVVLHKRAW